MRKTGAVALGDVAARATHIDVSCSRCERRGRYHLARLVARYGSDYAMTDLGSRLAKGCPQNDAPDFAKRCDVLFPNLADIMSGETP